MLRNPYFWNSNVGQISVALMVSMGCWLCKFRICMLEIILVEALLFIMKLILLYNFLNVWRNGVLFTNLHSGHLGISMMDSNTTEYIEKKNIFKLSNYWQFGNSSSSFGAVLYSIQNWNVLVCLQNDVKLVVPFSFENSKRSYIIKLWYTVRKGLLMLFGN